MILLLLFFVIVLVLATVAFVLWKKRQALIVNKKRILQKRIVVQEKRLEGTRKRVEAEQATERAQVVQHPPEVLELQKLCDEFEFSTRWACLIEIGDIYRKGAFPRFKPNPDMAEQCFKTASKCPDGDVVGEGFVKFAENRSTKIAKEDIEGREFPTEYGERICRAAASAMAAGGGMYAKSKMRALPPRTKAIPPSVRFVPDPVINAWPDAVVDDDYADTLFVGPVYVPAIDRQNVHDHGVQVALKANLETLEKAHATGKNLSFDEIKHALLSDAALSSEDKVNVRQVLDNLGESTHSQFGVTEVDALKLVWDRIQSNEDSAMKANLTETLGKQLASAIEHGSIVCSSGKIARILGTLDGADESMGAIRPLWVLKDEIANIASSIRDTVLEAAPTSQKISYASEGCEPLEEKMREEFATTVLDNYLKLGYAKSILEPMIDQYSAGF